jgi:DNA-binding MarR family transcriptional regulator
MRLFEMPGHLIRRLNQRSTQVYSQRMQEAGYDLTPVQFAALDAIHSTPGLDQSRIAAMIAYDRATIGGVIDRLEHKGLVTRAVSKRDRRAHEVKLSPRGRRVYEKVAPIVMQLQREILHGLSEEEQEQFVRLAGQALQTASTSILDSGE